MTQQSHCWAYTPRKPELKETCVPQCSSQHFIIARTWKQPRCPSADEWIRKQWYICTMEYSVQFSRSVVSDYLRPHELQHARPPYPSSTPSSLKLTSLELVMPSSHLILCHPLLLLPPIPPSIRVFSNASTLFMRWPKYWSFSFSIIPSKEIPGLISIRMTWLDLFSVQGTLKSLLQTTVQKHQFFGAQLSSQSNSHIHT